jgi:glycosyltransferase involved in cell wall biosynthesis
MTASISYAITTHNEGKSISTLLDRIHEHLDETDELVVLDDNSTEQHTISALNRVSKVYTRTFETDFSAHKNYLNTLCSKEYIFQFDGDELPSSALLTVVKSFIQAFPETDLFWFPRDNRLDEIDMTWIEKWKWSVDEQGRINYPDYQGRLFKNSDEIYWTRPVHEIITGHKSQRVLPANAGVDIYHSRHMDTQIKNNTFYDENF